MQSNHHRQSASPHNITSSHMNYSQTSTISIKQWFHIEIALQPINFKWFALETINLHQSNTLASNNNEVIASDQRNDETPSNHVKRTNEQWKKIKRHPNRIGFQRDSYHMKEDLKRKNKKRSWEGKYLFEDFEETGEELQNEDDEEAEESCKRGSRS